MKSLFFVFALALAAGAARAEVSNPNLLPFGEEEAFMGNAGIALDESTGATFYNPGGLGFIRNKKVSVYGNAYMADHTYIGAASQVNGLNIPMNSHSFAPVPLSSVSIFGNERFTYAFSIHVPYTSSYVFQMPLQAPSNTVSLIGNAQASSLWVGPSFGKRVSPSFGWGLSVYAVRYASSIVTLTNLDAVVAGTQVQGTSGYSAQQTAWAALALLGAQWQLGPDWRLGARLQTMSADIRGRSDYYSIGTSTFQSNTSNRLVNESNFHSRYRLPFQVGMGAKWSAAPRFDLLFDASAQFPLDYQTSPTRPQYSDRVLTKFVAHGNVGAKYRIGVNHALLAGLMYNPSAIPKGRSSLNSFSNENFKGVTLGGQYDGGVLVTTAGGFFLWSNGSYTLDTGSSLVTSEMEHQIFGILLTASYKL